MKRIIFTMLLFVSTLVYGQQPPDSVFGQFIMRETYGSNVYTLYYEASDNISGYLDYIKSTHMKFPIYYDEDKNTYTVIYYYKCTKVPKEFLEVGDILIKKVDSVDIGDVYAISIAANNKYYYLSYYIKSKNERLYALYEVTVQQNVSEKDAFDEKS